MSCHDALWARTAKNTDWSTWPLARPFACLLVRLHRSLVCLLHPARFARALRSHTPLRSIVRSLPHFAHFLTRGTLGQWQMAIYPEFFSILYHSVTAESRWMNKVTRRALLQHSTLCQPIKMHLLRDREIKKTPCTQMQARRDGLTQARLQVLT